MTFHIPIGLQVKVSDFHNASTEKQERFLDTFVNESNLIEGIPSPRGQTYHLYGDETNQEALTRSFPSFYHHKEALEYVLHNATHSRINSEHINFLHKTIMQSYRDDAGTWRMNPVYIRTPTDKEIIFKGMPYYRQVPRLMGEFEEEIFKLDVYSPTESDIWDVHHHFVSIHPYSDGNGRTARLLLNWLSLRHLNKFILIRNNHKQLYYDDIAWFQDDFREKRTDIGFYKDAIYDKEYFSRKKLIRMLNYSSKK